MTRDRELEALGRLVKWEVREALSGSRTVPMTVYLFEARKRATICVLAGEK